ncbi:MAG: type II secretion system protein GspG [Planctomycetota bacterium]|nr:type II secretion system protein GspG [Planctomycetota bacterium]
MVLLVSILGVISCFFSMCGRNGHHQTLETQMELSVIIPMAVLKGAHDDASPLAFPSGDIRSLYRWMSENAIIWRNLPDEWKDPARGVFVDRWGNALVYRFPSARREAMFDLYSAGPDGIDENGLGDDVSCPERTEFRAHLGCFAERKVDIDWIRSHFGKLQLDAKGEIIGVPPNEGK